MRLALAAGLALYGITSTAHADIIVPASAAITGIAGPGGLAGTFYHEGGGSTGFSVARTVALMNSSTANGRFVSTAVSYTGGDGSTITAFLGNNATGYVGATPTAYDLSDAILDLKGFVYIPVAQTIAVSSNHDDAEQLTIGGVVAISSNLGTSSTNVSFTAPGFYAIDLIYANTEYMNGVGGASLDLSFNGRLVTASSVVQSVDPATTLVPEPATLALIGVGLVATGLLTRRRLR